MPKNKKKRVLVITGKGKGKTTSAIGLIIRSIGNRQKAAIVKFFKKRPSGEDRILQKLGVKLYLFGIKEFFDPKKIPVSLKKEINKGWERTKKLGSKVDILVLDEINLVLAGKLISKQEVKNFITFSTANLVFTGRYAPDWLKKSADTISEIKDIKHIFRCGGKAEKGIEF